MNSADGTTKFTFHGAQVRWTPNQRAMYAGILLGLIACAVIHFPTFMFLFSLLMLALYAIVIVVRVVAVLAGLLRRNTVRISGEEMHRIPDADLPVYTVLLPVYREAEVIPSLLDSLRALDYPKDKLDVKLLLENNDEEAASVLRKLALPKWIEAVTVPDGAPRTKPRACNVGLDQARGDFVVIFDAEDRPEPDQLRKAVAAFRLLPDNVVCLQAKLNYYNSKENLLTRWCTIEYTAWFDLYLPGLHAIGSPIPLGGTSNHFRTAALKNAAGWDPYNVTEDCDLGVRLEWHGWETRVLDSTTWEESVIRWAPWLRQRSRWMKGYWQTHLCHTRDPLDGIRRLGLWKWSMMVVTVGGQVLTLLMNPVCWIIAGLWLGGRWQLFDPYRPWTVGLLVVAIAMALFNILFVAIHFLGAARRKRYDLLPLSILMPFYWVMVSIGAWRGFLQFFTRPFAWEKTPHGLTRIASEPHVEAAPEHARPSASSAPAPVDLRERIHHWRGIWTTGILAGLTFAIIVVACYMPGWLGISTQVRHAAVRLDGPCLKDEKKLDASWFGKTTLDVSLAPKVTRQVAPWMTGERAFRAVLYVKTWDGEWFQHVVDNVTENGPVAITFTVPLTNGWQSAAGHSPWGPWCLRRVREAGVRLFGDLDDVKSIKIAGMRATGKTVEPALSATLLHAPATVAQHKMFEGRFTLGREYENPFDPQQIDVWGVFSNQQGEVRIPAFYTRDYSRTLDGAVENLTPSGKPYWAVRFAPGHAGQCSWHLEGRDSTGAEFKTPGATFNVEESRFPGYVRVDTNDNFSFAFENGDFLYPVMMNVRSPVDERVRLVGWSALPDERGGTYLMDRYIDKMATAGITVARTWMMPSWGGLEWNKDWPGYHGLGFYNLQNAWRFDHLLDYAEQKNVLLEIALDAHGPFTVVYDSQWDINPYNTSNGGPIRRHWQVMTNEKAKQLFRNRYRYIAARFGASPALFGWNMWIEANVVSQNDSDLAHWHQELGAYLKNIDNGRHLISTEFTTTAGYPSVWELPEIGYTQAPAYNFGRGLVTTFQITADALRSYGKPAFIEEYGGHAQGGDTRWTSHEIHDGLWAGWNTRFSATPMAWWWNMILDGGLDRYYRRFADYIKGEDLRGQKWRYRKYAVDGADRLAALARYNKQCAYLWVYCDDITELRYTADGYWSQPKAGARMYRNRVGDFNPLDDKVGNLFGPYENISIDLLPLRLDDGTYEAEYWDTWTSDPPEKRVITVTSEAAKLPLPTLVRDVAIKLKRLNK